MMDLFGHTSAPKREPHQTGRAKLRQTLQRGPFDQVERGVWRAA